MVVFLYSLIQLFRWRCFVKWKVGFNYDLSTLEKEEQRREATGKGVVIVMDHQISGWV